MKCNAFLRLLLLLVCSTVVLNIRASASCGSASCPLNSYHPVHAGWMGLSIVHEYINQDRAWVGTHRANIGAIPEDHDEVQTLNERNVFRMQVGLTNSFGLNLDIPMVHREHNHIHNDSTGGEWEHWNFTGLGDIVLSGNIVIVPAEEDGSGFALDVIAGAKLASGITNAVSDGGEEGEVTIQPGTGSTDFIVGANFRTNLFTAPSLAGMYSAVPLTLGATYQANGRGSYDYRYGNSFLAHIGFGYTMVRHASLMFQLNGRFQGYADTGTTGEPKENTGGTWIFVSPGLGFDAGSGLTASTYIQFPVYQNVHGIQQTAPYNLMLSIGYSFDLNAE